MAGGVNTVYRIGRTVRRPAGPWTPAVHALLTHLAAAGFAGAPRPHGFDADGREILDFIEGDVADHPMPAFATTDEAVAEVARLLRAYHDATADFVAPAGAVWQLPPREPAEVICHGDVAGYNVVYRDGRPVALIDFDYAVPGPRLWDLAYAAYRFVPLTAPTNAEYHVPPEEQSRRLCLFAEAYGVDSAAERAALPEAVLDRLHHLAQYIQTQAALGHPAFTEHRKRGDDRLYLTDADHVARYAARFRKALAGPGPHSGSGPCS